MQNFKELLHTYFPDESKASKTKYNKTEKPFSPYGCARSDNSFQTDFRYVINIQFDIKTIIPNLTKF